MKRFWDKVEKGDRCWVWKACADDDGYGRFRFEGAMHLAHRVSWRLSHGAIPDETCVLHHCDNPSCVKPAHLFLGNHTDNMRDMAAKGRSSARRPYRHLFDRGEMRRLRARGLSQEAIGERMGAAQSTVSEALRSPE